MVATTDPTAAIAASTSRCKDATSAAVPCRFTPGACSFYHAEDSSIHAGAVQAAAGKIAARVLAIQAFVHDGVPVRRRVTMQRKEQAFCY